MLDGHDLGVAFTSDKFKDENIYPCVYLHNLFEKV